MVLLWSFTSNMTCLFLVTLLVKWKKMFPIQRLNFSPGKYILSYYMSILSLRVYLKIKKTGKLQFIPLMSSA